MLRFLQVLILIGYTMAQSLCNNIRDNHQNCIVEGCQIWFDGCQTCAIAYDGASEYVNMGCTTEKCKTLDKARCIDPSYHSNECKLEPIKCVWDNVCPVMREITHCSKGGIKGYTTYELSLELNKDVYNIYVMYGTEKNMMYIPPAKNEYSLLGANVGGVNPAYYNKYHSDAKYDSWLTLGITEGDTNHDLSSIGIKFDDWSTDKPLTIKNGAIFVVDAAKKVVTGNTYVIGHLTVKNDMSDEVIINVQGFKHHNQRLVPWITTGVKFPIKPLVKPLVNITNNGH